MHFRIDDFCGFPQISRFSKLLLYMVLNPSRLRIAAKCVDFAASDEEMEQNCDHRMILEDFETCSSSKVKAGSEKANTF